MYLVFVDHLIQEMQDRHIEGRDRFRVERLVPRNINHLTQDDIRAIFSTFQPDLQTEIEGFQTEVGWWKTMWGVANDQLKPGSIEETLQNVNHDLYPNIALCRKSF